MRQSWRPIGGPARRLFAFKQARWSTISDPITQGWAIVLGGSLGRLALGFVASVLIARALGPSDLAVYAVLAAVGSIGGAVVEFGLTESAVKRVAAVWTEQPRLAAERGRVFFWLRSGSAAAGFLLAIPVVLLLSPELAQGRVENGLLLLGLLGVVATALSGAVSALLQASSRFRDLSLVMLVNSGLTALLALGLSALDRLDLTSALVVLGIATSLGSFAFGRRCLPAPMDLRPPAVLTWRREAGQLLRFGSWLWIGNSLALLAAQLDLILVSRSLPPATTGIYALALTLAVKAEVVNHSLYAATLPAASALQSMESVRDYLRLGLRRGLLVGLALLPLLLLASPIITTIYGPDYREAAGLFQALLLVALLNVLAMPALLLAFTIDQPRLVAAGQALRVLVLFGLGLWLIPDHGTNGAVVARVGAQTVALVLTLTVLAALLPRYFRRAELGKTGLSEQR